MDDETIRIIVATDNHLGFSERDPIRCDDCFAAFEEILQTAKSKQADFILLAGDLFHENKPSRRTLHSTIELLRLYCLGSDPVYIEILNDQSEIFKNTFGRANYEDPYQSVSMPIFSIHGNHDDPSREGGLGDSLAALDLLSASNLINYFGKADSVEDIEVTPILIRKGSTNIAIYGLGAMRDERLNRMWNMKKVRFVRLTAEQGRDDFFNIFLIHQNRDLGRGTKNCIHESMIPEWMDLVIWGNEHECQPNLAESLVGTYRILQPGSSIACSLNVSESSQFPKHMAFVEVREKKFRMKPIRFSQVRQFVYGELRLQDFEFLQPNNPKIDDQIKGVLTTKINEMILEGRNEVQESLASDFRQQPKFRIRDPHKVLVRLKVDYAGFTAINFPRFTSQFAADVSNAPSIILAAKKRKDTLLRSTRATGGGEEEEDALRQLMGDGEDEVPKVRIEDLVNEMLSASKHSLSLLTESEVAQALDDFIVKKQLHAIDELVTETLDRTQKSLKTDHSAAERDAIVAATDKIRRRSEEENRKAGAAATAAKRGALVLPNSNFLDDVEDEVAPRAKQSSKKAAASSSAGGRGRKKPTQEEDDDEDEDDEVEEAEEVEDDDEAAAAAAASSSKRGAGARGRGTSAAKSSSSSSTAAAKSKSKAAAKPASAKASSSTSSTTAKRTARTVAAKAKSYAIADSDDELLEEEDEYVPFNKRNQDDDEEEDEVMDVDEIDEEEEDEEEVVKPPSRKGRGGTTTTTTKKVAKETAAKKPAAKGKTKAQSGTAQKKTVMNPIIEIDDDDDDDDKGRPAQADRNDNSSLFTGKSATSQLSFEPAATSKKRQLPISFSQTDKKGPTSSKSFSSGWDD
eukprot:gene28380-37312_t